MPFGLCNAPATFQSEADNLLLRPAADSPGVPGQHQCVQPQHRRPPQMAQASVPEAEGA